MKFFKKMFNFSKTRTLMPEDFLVFSTSTGKNVLVLNTGSVPFTIKNEKIVAPLNAKYRVTLC